jgi:hypothetical protein
MSALIRTPLRPVMLACAIALCSHATAQAAGDPIVAQSTVTLSGLSFQLIDLTPGDGIAPSLSFQTEGIIDTSNSVYDEASDSYLPGGPTYSNSLLPTTPVNYTTPDGLSTVTSTSNSVTLQSQLPLSQVLPPLSPPDGTGTGDYVYQLDRNRHGSRGGCALRWRVSVVHLGCWHRSGAARHPVYTHHG